MHILNTHYLWTSEDVCSFKAKFFQFVLSRGAVFAMTFGVKLWSSKSLRMDLLGSGSPSGSYRCAAGTETRKPLEKPFEVVKATGRPTRSRSLV